MVGQHHRARTPIRIPCQCLQDMVDSETISGSPGTQPLQQQINITSEGRPYLGAALGTQEYVRAYVSEKVRKWIDELNTLSTIAATQLHAAFAAFVHGFVHKFRFICRVCPDTKHLLQSLEESIRSRFIPAITGRDPLNNLIRDLLALPTHLGGMGLVSPTTLASAEYNASLCVAEPLKNAILEQDGLYSSQCWKAQMDAKKAVHNENRERTHNSSSALRQRVPHLSKQSHQLCTGERSIHAAGSLPTLWRSSIYHYTRGPSETQLLSGMAGNQLTFHQNVPVATVLL